jgi:large subunit ribosomal protein L25
MAFDSGISLTAQAREIAGSGSAKRLRRDGLVPMTIYGGKAETASGSVSKRELAAILRKSGRNAIFTLDLAGAATPVKIADMQLHPVKGSLIHVDFMRISLTEKTEFEVPVDVIGEAEGIRLLGAILDQPTHSLEIRCLPTDVPKSIEVDVTGLAVGDHLRVSDLKIDREKIEILADEDLVIVTVAAPRIVEEEAPVLEEPAEPEVIKKGKTDEEEEEKS